MASKKLGTVFFQMKNEALQAWLEERAIEIPVTEAGTFDRGAAIKAAEAWEVSTGEREVKEKLIRITINEQDGVNGGNYVFVGVNERSFYIPRNREVIVPEGVVNVLSHAVQIQTRAERQQDGTYQYYDVPVQRFSYIVHGPVEEAAE